MATKNKKSAEADKKKKKEDPHANEPITRKHVKRGKFMIKDVHRFLRYNEDVISDQNKEKIAGLEAEFKGKLETKETTRGELNESAEVLSKTCEKSVKGYKPSAIRENVESFFVVIVLVMGIRTYFAQPFKIPTGSMQPTLNGIIAYPDPKLKSGGEFSAPEGYEPPGKAKEMMDKLWYGRTHVNWVADRDMIFDLNKDSFYDKNHFMYFTRTHLRSRDGKTHFSAPGTKSRIEDLLKLDYDRNLGGYPVKKGDVIARGYVDTGDQVFVDRFTYHWKKPARGDVFVFNTKGIHGIEAHSSFDQRGGSQHYIKRLAGKPGDSLEVRPPVLMVNGEPGKEFGFKRVASQEGDYAPGYTSGPQMTVDLGPGEYWALGDNSDASFDSRSWSAAAVQAGRTGNRGVVPAENIVGRGLFVFLPFGHHFGPIR